MHICTNTCMHAGQPDSCSPALPCAPVLHACMVIFIAAECMMRCAMQRQVDADGAPVVPLPCMHRHAYEQLLLLRPCAAAAAAPAAVGREGASSQQHEDLGCSGLGLGHAARMELGGLAAGGGRGCSSQLLQPPEGRTIVTHPATHSRKPPVGPLLYQYCMRTPPGQGANDQGNGVETMMDVTRTSVCQAGGHDVAGIGPQVSATQVPAAAAGTLLPPPGMACLELFARELQPRWTSWGNEVLKFNELHAWFEPRPA